MKRKGTTCLLCHHFYFSPATAGYSEYTPGGEMSVGCYLDKWELDEYEDTDESYRHKMMSAETCKEFVEYKKKIGGKQ